MSGSSANTWTPTWTNDNGRRSDYYSNRENLYIKNGENYEKVELVRTGSSIWGYTFTYTFPDGSTIVSERNVTVTINVSKATG